MQKHEWFVAANYVNCKSWFTFVACIIIKLERRLMSQNSNNVFRYRDFDLILLKSLKELSASQTMHAYLTNLSFPFFPFASISQKASSSFSSLFPRFVALVSPRNTRLPPFTQTYPHSVGCYFCRNFRGQVLSSIQVLSKLLFFVSFIWFLSANTSWWQSQHLLIWHLVKNRNKRPWFESILNLQTWSTKRKSATNPLGKSPKHFYFIASGVV